MPSINPESGLKNIRAEFVAETTYGSPPTDPAYSLFSDVVRTIGPVDVGMEIFNQRGLGDVDIQKFFDGVENAGFPVGYHLHDRDLTNDPLNDAITRDADNNLANSHTVVVREERTLDVGADSGGSRVYTVGLGGLVSTWTLRGELSPAQPLLVTPEYVFQKVRSYQIDQPSSATLIGVNSTDAADTTQSVTVEDEDAGTTQTATLSGTTLVSMGVSTYADLDAIRLDAETKGDLEVWINTGSDATPAKGAVLATIRGTDSYSGSDGDLGVPLLGSGSHASAIGTAFAQLTSATVQWGGSALADISIGTVEITVDNQIETRPVAGSRIQKVLPGTRTVTATSQLVGDFQSHVELDEFLRLLEQDFTLDIGGAGDTNETITLSNAIKSDPGQRQYEAETGFIELSPTWTGRGVTIS